MRHFLHIGYDGTRYRGWQVQPGIRSVQGTIERILKQMFKTDITVYGCGRTDAGVHASNYVLHIDIEQTIDFDFKYRLNKNLPDDIAVFNIWAMSKDNHARFDVTSRTYEYFIHSRKDPVLDRYSSYYDTSNMNFSAMQEAVILIQKQKDFTSICKHPHLHDHTVCEIYNAQLFVNEVEKRLRFSITGNRFLKSMVRLIMHFLLKIGYRELSVSEFEEIRSKNIQLQAMKPASPNGLFLDRIEYPYLSIPKQQTICDLMKRGVE